MDLPPEDMFFPVGAVVQHETGRVEPVLDPECRHDVKCVLECKSSTMWTHFVSKLNVVLVPKPTKYVLTLHSLSMCDIELARGQVTPSGVQTWINHYNFE